MNFALSMCSLFLTTVYGKRTLGPFETIPKDYYNQLTNNEKIDNTELVLAFVMFRHGDRTPDQEELDLYPEKDDKATLFPFGPKALTNKGKQRSYTVGLYLRRRYDGLVNQLYLPEEMVLRTTDYDRTKMTGLAAMAGLYPPPPAQRWNPTLDWQPVPYQTIPFNDDDLLYWYNCPRYLWLRDQTYKRPEVKERIAPYQELFNYLTETTKTNITTPEDVFMLNNLFQALQGVGKDVPRWAFEIADEIKAVTKLEYDIELYNSELIRLASGVLIGEIRNLMTDFVNGRGDEHKLRLYSGHENNVAALMATVGVFEPHQPPYGSTFSLELRRKKTTGEYGVLAVYAWDPADNGRILPMPGCGGKLLCDFEVFLNLTEPYSWTNKEFRKNCPLNY